MNNLIWNEDMSIVYGIKSEFKSLAGFVVTTRKEFKELTGIDCVVSNARVTKCISTSEGLGAETITPIEDTDIEINTYYVADVEESEEE